MYLYSIVGVRFQPWQWPNLGLPHQLIWIMYILGFQYVHYTMNRSRHFARIIVASSHRLETFTRYYTKKSWIWSIIDGWTSLAFKGKLWALKRITTSFLFSAGNFSNCSFILSANTAPSKGWEAQRSMTLNFTSLGGFLQFFSNIIDWLESRF